MRKLVFITIISVLSVFSSCDSFLNVQPKGMVEEGLMFNNTQGFCDAMYGVYAKMAKNELYGENLSYGFVDKIGQMFCYLNTNENDYYIVDHKYEDSRVRPKIDEIWLKQYEVILYVNNVIKHSEKTTLTDPIINLIKGEAYGLRAFLHFDIVRLFAESYKKNPQASGIPYSFSFDHKTKTVYSLKEVYGHILSDLDKAEEILKNDNTVNWSSSDLGYDVGRAVHFNKYAVYATKARVYYSMGDEKKASEYAQKVIDAKENFELTFHAKFGDVKRFPAPKEMIFGLNREDLSKHVFDIFVTEHQGLSSGNITEARKDLDEIFEISSFDATNNDVRYSTYYKKESRIHKFIRFVVDANEVNMNVLHGLTLIRLPEMYYILSECSYDTDMNKSLEMLNAVRKSRGLKDLTLDKISVKELFEKELMNERIKEFAGEGQVFYALKHYDKKFRNFTNKLDIEPSNKVFVLPWPTDETILGNKPQ